MLGSFRLDYFVVCILFSKLGSKLLILLIILIALINLIENTMLELSVRSNWITSS